MLLILCYNTEKVTFTIQGENMKNKEMPATILYSPPKEKMVLKEGFTRNQAHTHNDITNAKHNLSATQLKIFYQCATLIDPVKDRNFREYTISVKDFCEKLGLNNTNRDFIVSTLKKLLRQVIEIESELDGKYRGYPVFSLLDYDPKEQKIQIAFNDYMISSLLELKENFTKIQQVKYIINFESKYSIRFYAFLKDYRKMSQRDFNIDFLNEILELPKSITTSYTRFYDKVLKPAITEINAKSDLWVSEPEIIGKRGKKITDFRLYFGNKSEKMGNDFVRDLIKRYKKHNTFNVFANAYYLATDELKSMSDLRKIVRIETEHNTYFTAKSKDYNDEYYTIFGTANKDDFLKELANGIYRAVNALYEKEKQEQLPTMQWQDKTDKAERIKQIFLEWQQADTQQKNF